MKYPHIAAKIYDAPWLIDPSHHRNIAKQFEAHISGARADVATGDMEPDDDEPRLVGSVQIIPVHGILGKHLGQLEMMCGGCDVDEVGEDIDEAEADPRVQTILLDFRSPGGTVTGVPELGNKIASCTKTTAAFTDSQCCSGALWLASCCEQFQCTESALVGSCGVYSIYFDHTAEMESEGVKANAISSGEFKLAGAYFKPMTDAERTMLQTQCDSIHSKFKAVIQKNRNVDDSALQGQVFMGDEAAMCGMVDGIVEDMDEFLKSLEE